MGKLRLVLFSISTVITVTYNNIHCIPVFSFHKWQVFLAFDMLLC